MASPNVFIIGAPKCGTTTVADWIGAHPDAFMSPVKEPHYFNTDESHRFVRSEDEYRQLFDSAPDSAKVVAEASTWYLHSDNAVPNILEYAVFPKFVVCLRNPVDMAFSLHGQFSLRSLRENELSFSKAWALSDHRLFGDKVAGNVTEPKHLAYRYSCKLGTQLLRLTRRVPRSQVHLVVLDDLKASPQAEYDRLLSFLGLPHDGRSHFSALNERAPVYSTHTHRALNRARRIKRAMGVEGIGFGIANWLASRNKNSQIPRMSSNERLMLTSHFEAEIELMFLILGRRYDAWLSS